MNFNYAARLSTTGLIAGGAFWISANHWIHVATAAGNDLQTAAIYPLAIDALIVGSTLTLLARTGVNRMAKWYAGLGRAFGFGATIYGNLAASEFTSLNSAIINLLPAIALIISVETLVHAAQATPATRARKAPAKKRGTTAKHTTARLRAVK